MQDMQEERVSLPKSQTQLAKMDDDDDVFATSIVDQFSAQYSYLKQYLL